MAATGLQPWFEVSNLQVHIEYPGHPEPPDAPEGHHWTLEGTVWTQDRVAPAEGVYYDVVDSPGMGYLVLSASFSACRSWAFTGVNAQGWQLFTDDYVATDQWWGDTRTATVTVTINEPGSGRPPYECKGEGYCCCADAGN